ncbi:MAG: hypothetical protein JNM99_14295 [Verrucomicrobiaceae bacterium]|nr:hypothetical protein [Verrucomicrobiaceae bacterium]
MTRFCHYLIQFVFLTASGFGAESHPPFHSTTLAAIDQANTTLWTKCIDSHGVILDFVGEIPTPEDCAVGKPNAIGWWSPIEDGPMFTGLYLPAACERARRSGKDEDKAKARRLAQGLIKCASVSDVPGFIARGMGTDGKCHYPLGSDDQTHPWFYGLHTYCMSDLPSVEERDQIVAKMKEVAAALEANGWKCPCDGAFKGDFRGAFRGHLFRDAVRYLYMLKAMHDVTKDKVWLTRYHQALEERPPQSEQTRIQICAQGCARDHEAIKNINDYQQWIYVGSQASLAGLVAMETNEVLKTQYRTGLMLNAESSLKSLEAHKLFDNKDTKVFGDADWRAVYATWFPQPTQAEAQRMSGIADKAKRGERKHYESRYMRNPLAAAAIVALAGDGTGREAIEQTLQHFDYSKLNMSVFFFAECAYYALPDAR